MVTFRMVLSSRSDTGAADYHPHRRRADSLSLIAVHAPALKLRERFILSNLISNTYRLYHFLDSANPEQVWSARLFGRPGIREAFKSERVESMADGAHGPGDRRTHRTTRHNSL